MEHDNFTHITGHHEMNAIISIFLGILFLAPVGVSSEPPSTARIIFTRDNPPITPKIDDLMLTDSVTQYGITWKFDKMTRVGQFVTGDWYVVGNVVIVDISPRPLVGVEVPPAELGTKEMEWRRDQQYVRNGSMLNPPALGKVAYDSAIRNYFEPKLIQRLPIVMKPGDSLVSTISLQKNDRINCFIRGVNVREGPEDDSPLRTAAVLTCLSDPAPPDAFRPAYGDRQATIFFARDLKRDLLPRLNRPPGQIELEDSQHKGVALAPGHRIAGKTSINDWIRAFSRPWINTCWFGFDIPVENMPRYGREISRAVGIAGLLLCCDYSPEEKESLLIGFVQVGIDHYGLIRAGHSGWEAWGGHHSGRKMPIVFAGLLLGNEAMAAVSTSFPAARFQEDGQTAWGKGWTGAKAIFTGHSGNNPARPKWGPYEHKSPDQWDAGNKTSEAYRRTSSSLGWVGQTLVMRMLHAEPYWNNDAYFAYVDRWMTEDDSRFVEEIKKGSGYDASPQFARQRQCWDPFVMDMWSKYRSAPGMPPTDQWQTKE